MTLVIVFNIIAVNNTYTGYASSYTIVYITTAEELISFSKECSNDAYSIDKLVILKNDINLSGYEFSPIPVFSGIFDGNGCTISGLSINCSGSFQGLIRYATDKSIIRNLIVDITLVANGSGSYIGGIAGSNSGMIVGCSTIGSIEGVSSCGGIVGLNNIDGIIVNCTNKATISAINKPAGIAGFNYGSIGGCGNEGSIQFKEGSNFDAGGIAAISGGRIVNCANTGEIGLSDRGYNVGGIVGRVNGYVSECTNNGNVSGLKDIGGIAGQFDPRFTYVEIPTLLTNEDAIASDPDSDDGNINDNELEDSDDDSELGDSDNDSDDDSDFNDSDDSDDDFGINDSDDSDEDSDFNDSDNEMDTEPVRDSDDEDDEDSVRNYHRADTAVLSANMSNTQNGDTDNNNDIDSDNDLDSDSNNDSNSDSDSDNSDNSSDSSGISSLIKDLEAGLDSESPDTIPEAVTNYGFDNTDEELFHQIIYCINSATVTGDTNVGGIVGNISYEIPGNKVDDPPDSDFGTDLDNSIEIVGSINDGDITFTTKNAGGIVGHASAGSLTYNISRCTISGSEGSNAGGIAGYSNVEISKSFSVCTITAKACAGGIAGYSNAITECYSLPSISKDSEQKGAIAGKVGELIDACYFLNEDLQAVDGIDYNLKTVPLTMEQMTGSSTLPEAYSNFEEDDWCIADGDGTYIPQITFLADNDASYISDALKEKSLELTDLTIHINFYDGETLIKTIDLSYGDSITDSDIPDVPLHSGEYGEWPEFQKENITQSADIYAVYSPFLSSINTGENPPVVIVEGTFDNNSTVTLEDVNRNEVRYQADYTFVNGYNIVINDDSGNENSTIMVHYLTSIDAKHLKLTDAKGYNIPYERDGDYVIFQLYEDRTFSVFELQKDYTHIKILLVVIIVIFIIAAGILLIRKIIKKRLTKKQDNNIIIR